MDNLYVLYLNNTAANPELATLFGYTNPLDRKIIFQFFHDVSNELTLYAWPRVAGNYNSAHTKILHISSLVKIDISGSPVHLGNCHLNNAECKKLHDVINQPGCEFILFYPWTFDDPVDGTKHIAYDIYGNTTLPLSLHEFFTQITTANPSPPRPAI